MIKKLLFTSALCLIPCLGIAQNQYSYGFDGVTTNLTTDGWERTNQSSVPTASLWTIATYQPVVVNGNIQPNLPFGDTVLPDGAICPAPNGQAGGTNSFALVNYSSSTGNNTISNWLISPNVTVQNGDVVTFYTRLGKIPGSSGTQFPDRLQLRMSSDATTIIPTTGPTDVGTFNEILVDVNPTLAQNVYPQVWTQYSATISGLNGPTAVKFAFRYFVTDGGTLGDNSDIIGIDTFSVDRPTASTQDFANLGLSMYPNPVSDVLNISSNNGLDIQNITITDINGRTVKQATTSQINVSDLASGTYIVKVQADKGTATSKFIKK